MESEHLARFQPQSEQPFDDRFLAVYRPTVKPQEEFDLSIRLLLSQLLKPAGWLNIERQWPSKKNTHDQD